jgi:hypothetical protein
MLEFADKLAKKSKNKSPFTEQVLEQARIVRSDEDPDQRTRRCVKELQQLVVQLNETHKKTNKVRRVTQFLQPFVDGVVRFTSVVDALVQLDPVVAAHVWQGAKFVLQVCFLYFPPAVPAIDVAVACHAIPTTF